MSDRSFGDHTNRNIVKNPLLSTAVTGLSLDDLTHKAVLLPVSPTQGQITQPEQQRTKQRTLGDATIDNIVQPHGDTLPNITLINNSQETNPQLDNKIYPKNDNTLQNKTPQSTKKSDDNFDVNEYFARLQGTRYVSAPIHSQIKTDPNANLQTEENLEEINLNETNQDVAQSLTADIAQNFSQLPTVLPHVASAVFSSFSNMLNMRSKEQIPDTRVQEVQKDVSVPLMGVEDVAKEFAPPPKEPPVMTGTNNYRLPTKKKYAQIPGLSYGDHQNMAYNQPGFMNQPQMQATPSFFTPEQNIKEDTQSIYDPIENQAVSQSMTSYFVPEKHSNETDNINKDISQEKDTSDNVPNISTDDMENQEKSLVTQSQSAQIIPPPPMFSGVRKDSQSGVKAVLPPSVARRVSANQPVIKQKNLTQILTDNIFVPVINDVLPSSEANNPNFAPIETFTNTPPMQSAGSFMSSNSAFKPVEQAQSEGFMQTNQDYVRPPSQYKDSSQSITQSYSLSDNPPKSEVPFYSPSEVKPGFGSNQPESAMSSIYMTDAQFANMPPKVPSLITNEPRTVLTPNLPQTIPPSDVLQTQANEPSKPISEPPKATGNTNFRMTKKRPQYYSGPIEGVGSISNNMKPTIPDVMPSAFQPNLFTPEPVQQVPIQAPNLNLQATAVQNTPYTGDLNKESYTPFDLSQPSQSISSTYPQSYNTTFDLSRATTEQYEEPKRDTGFGIIGSLKSKLSSLDINKIQNTVTTFFDPAYNDTRKPEDGAQQNMPYQQSYEGQSNFNIFVPPVDQYSQFGQNTGYNYNEYYQNQYSYGQNVYPPNLIEQSNQYSTENAQNYYANQNIPFDNNQNNNKTIENNYYTQNIPTEITHVNPSDISTMKIEESNKNDANKPAFDANLYTVENIANKSVKPSTEDVQPLNQESAYDNSAKAASFFDITQPTDTISKANETTSFFNPLSSGPVFDVNDKMSNLSIGNIGTQENIEVVKSGNIGTQKNTEVESTIIGKELNKQLEEPKETKEKNLLESLSKPDVTMMGVSSVPLFGLSAIIADKSREMSTPEPINVKPQENVFKNTNVSFFENLDANDKKEKPILNISDVKNVLLIEPPQENICTVLKKSASSNVLDKQDEKHITNIGSPINEHVHKPFDDKSKFFEHKPKHEFKEEVKDDSLSICETCREVNSPTDKDSEDFTWQLIENITAPIQLSNPVGVPLVEKVNDENAAIDNTQLDEITNITEDTIEMLQVQSATELLDDTQTTNIKNYGWNEDFTPTNIYNTETEEYGFKTENKQNFDFKIDPNSIGFFSNNSLFFDNVPNNASEEIKAEYQGNDDVLPREVTIPTAPPDEDTKSDETGGLDVHSIEQDAKKDFLIEEEFVIEPSETDDDKIEFRERRKSSEESSISDTFTNRVERFQKETEYDQNHSYCAPKSMASYFDTGNYAVETHYKNYFNQVGGNTTVRIPPGFEEKFRRRMSAISLCSSEKPPSVPETSTQTKVIDTPTYSRLEKSPDVLTGAIQTSFSLGTDTQLPDPINFFSSSDAPTESVNRLASYFAEPATKEEHKKSFFELSQSQNHYRHASSTQNKNAQSFFDLTEQNYIDNQSRENIKSLIKDLTSTQNFSINEPAKTVNYFTVEFDFKNNANIKNVKEFVDCKESKAKNDINLDVTKCAYCCSILNSEYKIRKAVNETEREGSIKEDKTNLQETNMNKKMFPCEKGYSIEQDGDEEVSVVQESNSSEYTPVRHHWFYRVDVEEKSVWRGFSIVDSKALEDAFNNPELSESTLVPTDGGRYDVNVVGRLRIAVYWKEKPTNVRRCSWFYKGTTDARYVPYTEQVAEKLEEEYRHGVTTGEWHRKLTLPNNEMVIMHGPSVMVHFLSGGAADAFTSPTILLGKKVYRNPPKVRVAKDQQMCIDHVLFMVHGAGEYKKNFDPSSRPRVVRRGHEESEIEDSSPSSIEHLLLLCHGVGSACDMRFRSLEEVVEDFRSTSLQLIQSHYKNSYDNGVVNRVEVLPISWHAQLHSGETGVDRRLSRITLDSIPRLRAFTNHTVLDVLFYTSPVYHQTIMDTVCSELNRIYSLFKKRNPDFKGGVSLGGHSLGSVILYDLLCNQSPKTPLNSSTAEKNYLPGIQVSENIKYPVLEFSPDALYALGSPIAIFECIRGVESLGMDFCLPTCKKFFNIFHPYDPIAYRIEPLINPQLQDVKPYLIPHHKGRKRMHLELKDTMARVGADLKQKLIESLRTTWNKWKSTPPTDGQLEKVVEEEMEKQNLCDENKEESTQNIDLTTPEMLGRLNDGQRIDYVLQEAPLEMINEYLFAMRSHVGYWESEDTMLLILREVYSSLGVQPDSTVPQQSMTVQRTRTLDEASIVNEKDYPSTSRGGT